MTLSFSDFLKIHYSARAVIIGIALLMPFWYIDIYLFDKRFFNTSQFYIPIVFSFCLSISYLILNSFFAIFYLAALERTYDPFEGAVIISIPLISIFTYSSYVIFHSTNFVVFITDIFLSAGGLCIISVFMYIIKMRTKPKTEKKEEVI
jgi:hypothetical protein